PPGQGRPCGVDGIAGEWGGEGPPATARKPLHVHLTRLRAKLRDGLLVRTEAGYRLEVEPASVDLSRFLELADEGRRLLAANRPDAAASRLRQALALWRGAPLAGLGHGPFPVDGRRRPEEAEVGGAEGR